MGLNPQWARPEWMMIKVLPIPPPHVRPSVSMDSSTIGEDDLTLILSSIIKVIIICPFLCFGYCINHNNLGKSSVKEAY